MRKNVRFVTSVIVIVLTLFTLFNYCSYVNASDNDVEMFPAKATAYCLKGTTASGCEVRNGICAGKKEWLGCTLIMYQRLPGNKLGKIIGIYEIKDTGGAEGIQLGRVIDVWCEDKDACQDFMNQVYEDECNGNVFIQIVKAEG